MIRGVYCASATPVNADLSPDVGALAAHAQAVRSGAAPTICLNGRRLEPFMAKSLFDTELKRNADVYEADMPVQLVMVNALSAVYPC